MLCSRYQGFEALNRGGFTGQDRASTPTSSNSKLKKEKKKRKKSFVSILIEQPNEASRRKHLDTSLQIPFSSISIIHSSEQ